MPDASLEQTVAAILALTVGSKLPMRAAVVQELAKPPTPLALDAGVYGQALNDARKVLAARAVPVVAKTLDSPLTDLFVAGSLDKSMYRYDKQLMELIKRSVGFTPPQERMIQKLATVLAQCEHQGVLATSHARALSIRAFLQSGPDGQMRTVNALWNECTVAGVYDVRAEAMQEPDNAANLLGKSQLPSSVRPERSGGGEAKTFTRGQGGTPYKTLGVGFRVEGSCKANESLTKLDSHIDRISKGGMVPQVTLNWLMLDSGKDIEGTEVGGNALAPRLNVAQRDLWNESGVCVARSFFGATAFPLREHVGKAVLWAIDVAGLVGYDTEDWQLRNPAAGAGPWRPGEKCFPRVPKDNILGYIVIDKMGDVGGGWKFSVPRGAKWEGAGFPRPAQARYMEEELAAWAGVTATVPTLYDFQQ